MEEINNEDGRSIVGLPIPPLLPPQEDPNLHLAIPGVPLINGAKANEEVVKEYEASSSSQMVHGVSAADPEETKSLSPMVESKALVEDVAAEIPDLTGIATRHASDDDKLEKKTELLQPAKGGDVNFTLSDDREKNVKPLLVSKEAILGKADFDIGLSPSLPQEETVIRPSKTPEAFNLSSSSVKPVEAHRALIDTAAPFESVKEAVTKFGGIIDWKSHKMQTAERRKLVELELEKVQKEVPECKKELETAEIAKSQVLQELDSTKRLIEQLKVDLERALTEEEQAKQDSKFAQMRVEEIKQGIADEASIAAKAQLDAAKARHEAALYELKMVKDELDVLKGQYLVLLKEKDKAVKKAEDAISASKELEKTVEDLTLELMTTKESLGLAHALHLEAEEQRVAAALARDQEILKQEREMKMADEEIQRLTEQLSASNDLKAKLETASSLLLNLKAELAAYMEAKLESETCEIEEEKVLTAELEEAKQAQRATLAALSSTTTELEDVKVKIEKAKEEVKCLRVAAASLKAELEREKSAFATMRQREGIASVTVSALEAELTKTRSEIEAARMREKEVRESMVELPKALQQAAQEADEAKLLAQFAQEDLHRVKEEAEFAKAGASTTESRLHAALKEIEAAQASQKLALAAIKALHESETASSMPAESEPSGVTLSLEQYYELSKKAHEAEELANARVAAAISEIDAAKESESNSLERLEAANRELTAKREALRVAKEKAERAKEGKLGVEQELRKWRAEHEQRRKAKESASRVINPISSSPTGGADEGKVVNKSDAVQDSKVFIPETGAENSSPDTDMKKKKKSLFPKIVMFMGKKKSGD
ncbi:unnamed protein product [Victoria cruziana]